MGMMIDGIWVADTNQTIKNDAFVRAGDVFDRQLDETTLASIAAGARRHVLVASKSCPWSHRVVLLRAVKRLGHRLPLHVAGGPRMEGYGLRGEGPLGTTAFATPRHLHQLYRHSDGDYTGRVTVPLLWDAQDQRILCNNSNRLIRGLDGVAAGFILVPEDVRAEIDDLNADIYQGLSNAVYKAGLAQSQGAYDDAVERIYATLDRLEARLADRRFLFGSRLTESDLMAFATLVRFDAVYATHFRCTRRRLVDYPQLRDYARDLFQLPGVAETVDFAAILEGYYRNDGDHNPHGIVAEQPQADWRGSHGRERFGPVLVQSTGSGPVPLSGIAADTGVR